MHYEFRNEFTLGGTLGRLIKILAYGKDIEIINTSYSLNYLLKVLSKFIFIKEVVDFEFFIKNLCIEFL